MFAPAMVDQIAVKTADAAITARMQGTIATLSEEEAATTLGWAGGQFRIAIYTKRIQPNLVGRFTRSDVADLAANSEFREKLLRFGTQPLA